MHKFIAAILLMLFGQQGIMTGPHRKIQATACPGVPVWNAQYIASTVAPGSVTTWSDSSGNGNTLTGFFDGSNRPTAGVADPTPNGTATIKWASANNQSGIATTVLTVTTGLTVCGVWKSPVPPTNVATVVLALGALGGAPAVYGFDSGIVFDKQGNANIGSTTGTPISANTWYTTCLTYVPGTGAWAHYINGTLNNSGTNVQTFSQPMDRIQGGSGTIPNSPNATIAEIDWALATSTPTQVAAVHTCAVQKYGVP